MSNKHAYLKAMGIDLWCKKNTSSNLQSSLAQTEPQPEQNHVVVEVKQEQTQAPAVSLAPQPEAKSPAESQSTIDIENLDWQALFSHAASCKKCDLSKDRRQTNLGAGNQTASLLIIADDRNKKSEQLLTAMLKAINFQRSDVYITDITKCELVETKEVSDEHTKACEPYLLRQIELVKPKLILALGNNVAQHLLKTKSNMNRLRGQLHYVEGIIPPILVSYHPTYLLAAANEKRKAWEDLQRVMKELEA